MIPEFIFRGRKLHGAALTRIDQPKCVVNVKSTLEVRFI